MNDSIIAFRAKEQLGKFLGKVFAHFSKPRKKFLADMLYGIQASGDTQLSSVMRAVNDDPDMRHAVEKRLSRNVANEDIGDEIDRAILAEGARHVRDDTLILVDPTEIRKGFGLRMEHVTMVRDASRSSKEGREVLAEHLKSLSQRLGKVPEFANYAIADGLRRAFTRFGRWCRKIIDPEPEPSENDLLELLPGFRDLFAADTC